MNKQALYYIGVDVGTGSARAGIFDRDGRMLGAAHQPIQIWTPETDFAEQSTEDIWQACAGAVREAVAEAGVAPDQVGGLGFDATCSLAVVDGRGQPVTVSLSGEERRNVIVWMDHRATEDAEAINATGHEVLRYVGGKVSPEMQTPKLRWLKKHLPGTWQRAEHFFDLADYLTYRATGDATRSLCTTTCKWTYLGHKAEQEGTRQDDTGQDDTAGWAGDFWRAIGLEDLAAEEYERIGLRVRPVGEATGEGLTEAAAEDLGLRPGTPVGVALIDAHAGGLGLLGAPVGEEQALTPEVLGRHIALIGGTSTCHMAVSPEPRFIDGVWGPYFSAMVPGWWLTEGGQSATGALIDHVIFSHARAAELKKKAEESGRTVYELLNETLDRLASGLPFRALLTRERHVLPYFHGNRSPRADPSLRGMATGLRLSDTVEELALQYLATVQGIAHGTRHIIEVLNDAGYQIDTIVATGGGTKNPVFLQEHADITGCRVILPKEPEAVLLGSAMLGAVAAGAYGSVAEAMTAMSRTGEEISPAGGAVAAFHVAKHQVFQRLYEDQMAYRRLIGETAP